MYTGKPELTREHFIFLLYLFFKTYLGTGKGKQQCSIDHQRNKPFVCHVGAEGHSLHIGLDSNPVQWKI